MQVGDMVIASLVLIVVILVCVFRIQDVRWERLLPAITVFRKTNRMIPQGSHFTVIYDPARPRRRGMLADDSATEAS